MRLKDKEENNNNNNSNNNNNNWLLTTGVNDECIMKWRLEVEDVS